MKIRYTGRAGVRIVGPYRWDESNDFVQDVTDQDILMDLLTYPRPVFGVVDEPPAESAPQVIVEENSRPEDEHPAEQAENPEAEYEKSEEKPRKGRARKE